MATTYKMQLKNATDQSLYFIVFQRFPVYGLDSVAWKVCGLPAPANIEQPTVNSISWSMEYGIAIVNFQDEGSLYTPQKRVGGMLGNIYSVTSSDDVPNISGVSVGTTSQDQIVLENKTGPATKVNQGFTLSGDVIGAERCVGGGEMSIYKDYNRYYVACSSSHIVTGQVIDLPAPNPNINIVIPAIEVKFPEGVYDCTVMALSLIHI